MMMKTLVPSGTPYLRANTAGGSGLAYTAAQQPESGTGSPLVKIGKHFLSSHLGLPVQGQGLYRALLRALLRQQISRFREQGVAAILFLNSAKGRGLVILELILLVIIIFITVVVLLLIL